MLFKKLCKPAHSSLLEVLDFVKFKLIKLNGSFCFTLFIQKGYSYFYMHFQWVCDLAHHNSYLLNVDYMLENFFITSK